MTDADVLIVGAGPTGLTVANLLGSLGASVRVIEQDAELVDEPRAVSIDDEAMRAMDSAGLFAETRQVAVPGTGTRYFGSDGRSIAYARGRALPRFGHPVKNQIDQPEFTAMLFAGLGRFGKVRVSFSTRLESLRDEGDEVVAGVRLAGGEAAEIRSTFALGCDGGRSTARGLAEINMVGSSLAEPWIVVDTTNDPHDERYAMHHGEPERPHVIVPYREGRCRYEFMLLPGEDPHAAVAFPFISELLRPYRSVTPQEIRRCAVYTFHALVADPWRRGRVLLLGDAAHMMPPFAGQGLNTGIRDAHNVAWKLALVLTGDAGEGLLDTYERERRPHAEAMIRLSLCLGRIMMTRSRTRASLRDAAMRALSSTEAGRRYFRELRFKPEPRFAAGALVPGRPPCGAMLPQPEVLTGSGERIRLDEALGPWFSLVAVDPPGGQLPTLADPLWSRLGATRLGVYLDDRLPLLASERCFADADATLGHVLDWMRGRVMLVRPDRYVAGVFDPADERAFAAAAARILHMTTLLPARLQDAGATRAGRSARAAC